MAPTWEGTNEQPEHSRLNPHYWRAFDVMMRAPFTHGLTAHLFLRVYNKKVTWPANGSREDDLFFKYVVARYGAFSNVVWDFSTESYNERDKGYCANRIALVRALDGHERLVTTHDDWALHFDHRYGSLLDFMRETNWWELETHPEIVERSAGRCVARPGQEYVIFCRGEYGPRRHFDEPQRALIQLPGVHTPVNADWLNPLTGERTQTTLEPRPRLPLQAPFAGPYVVRLTHPC